MSMEKHGVVKDENEQPTEKTASANTQAKTKVCGTDTLSKAAEEVACKRCGKTPCKE